MKKGFTLIELLAVIVILAVISLIATPIVLDVIDSTRNQADKQTVNGIEEAARLYFTESMIDEEKQDNIKNLEDIYSEIVLNGKKPEQGKLYVNENGVVALSVVVRDKCYKHGFGEELQIIDGEECNLGYVGNDKNAPTVNFKVNEEEINNNWYTETTYVNIEVVDTESGPNKLKWCLTNEEECEPTTEETSTTKSVELVDSKSNKVCVIGYDNFGNYSEITCTPVIKVDTIKPEFSGIADITINVGENIDLESGVSVSDVASGVNGTYTYTPTSINTNVAGTYEVVYQATDNAGNTQTITRKVIIDAEAPTATFTVQGSPFNASGWANENFFVKVEIIDQSGTNIKEAKWCSTTSNTCIPTATMTGTSMTPEIEINSNNNRICVQATDNNNKTSEIICSDAYKLDTTSPTVTAKTGTFEIEEGANIASSNYFNAPVYSSLSGNGSMSCSPANTSKLTVGTHTITCTATGVNGKTGSASVSIKVEPKKYDLAQTLLKQYNASNTVGLLKDSTGYYYKGSNTEVANNFVWFAGHLWRVISIDTNNNITMITQQPLTAIQPASSVWTNQAQYEGSYINHWLNSETDGVFYQSLIQDDKDKIINSTFKVGTNSDIAAITTTQKVGLLNYTQYKKAGLSTSFLNIKDNWWLGNLYDDWDDSHVHNVKYNGYIDAYGELRFAYGVRPVIKISNLIFTTGKGTLDDPFRESSTTTNTSNIKVGEYVSIPTTGIDCGTDKRCLFRVVSKDNNSIKVILNGLLSSESSFGSTKTYTSGNTIDTAITTFAGTINQNYRYSGTDKTFGIGTYGKKDNYTAVQTPTYTGNVGLPVIGEMFSGNDIDISTSTTKTFVNVNTIENPTVSSNFWTITANNAIGSSVHCISDGYHSNGKFNGNDPSTTRGVRPVLFLNQGLTFTGGEGTAEHPFMLSE